MALSIIIALYINIVLMKNARDDMKTHKPYCWNCVLITSKKKKKKSAFYSATVIAGSFCPYKEFSWKVICFITPMSLPSERLVQRCLWCRL